MGHSPRRRVLIVVVMSGLLLTAVALPWGIKQQRLEAEKRVAESLSEVQRQERKVLRAQQRALQEQQEALRKEREAIAERRGNLAREVLAVVALPDTRFYRADRCRVAQIEVARRNACTLEELRAELAAGLADCDAIPPGESSAISRDRCGQAGNLAWALFRLDGAESWYRQGTAAPDDGTGSLTVAEIEEKLSEVLHDAERFAEEKILIETAMERAESSGDTEARIRAVTRRAFFAHSAGNLAAADLDFHEAAALVEEQFAEGSSETIHALQRLTNFLLAVRSDDEGPKTSLRVLALCEKRFGAESPEVATELNNRARRLIGEGKAFGAQGLLERSFAIRKRVYGLENPRTIDVISNLGHVMMKTNRYEDADAFYQQALDLSEKVLPADHLEIGDCLLSLADAARARNRLARQESMLRGALEILEKSGGPENLSTLNCLMRLADLFQNTHRPVEAEEFSRRVMEGKRFIYGTRHPTYGQALCNWGMALIELGRLEEGRKAVEFGSGLIEATAAVSDLEKAAALRSRALVENAAGQYLEASRLLRAALEKLEKAPSSDQALLTFVLNDLAMALKQMGQVTEAKRYFNRALEAAGRSFGPDHHVSADLMCNLAMLLKEDRQPAEALPYLRQALEIYELSFGKIHPRVALAMHNTATVLCDLRRLEEAEKVQRRALEITEKCSGLEGRDVCERLNVLGYILEVGGNARADEPVIRRFLTIVNKLQPLRPGEENLPKVIAQRYVQCLERLGLTGEAIQSRVERARAGQPLPDL